MNRGVLFQVRWHGCAPVMEILEFDVERERARQIALTEMFKGRPPQVLFIDTHGHIELWNLGSLLAEGTRASAQHVMECHVREIETEHKRVKWLKGKNLKKAVEAIRAKTENENR